MNNQTVPTPTNQVAGQGGGSLQQELQRSSLTEIEEEVSLSGHPNGSTSASSDATPSAINRLILRSTPAKVFHFVCSVVASLCSSFVGGNYNKEIPYTESYLPINDGNHSVSAVSSPSSDDSAPSRQDQPTSSSSNQEIVCRANNLNNDSVNGTRARNGGLVVSSHQTPSKDPQERLISDCFLHLLSFLPPESIATTEAVSSRWRNEIRSSGSLHQEMNLMRLGLEVPIKDFIIHFHRLSLLAHHRLVKVSLNMSSCWADYLWKGKIYDNTACRWLFESLLFGTKDSLREVSLVFRLDSRFFHEFNHSFFPLVNSLLQQLQSFPLLESICIEGPTGVSFVLQSDQNRFRAFKIKDNFNELDWCTGSYPHVDLSSIITPADGFMENTDLSHIVPIAEHGKRFMGDGASFTEFDASYTFQDIGDPSTSILDSLSSSKSSLKNLQLHWDWSNMELRHVWDFVIQCDNLKSLSLDLVDLEAEEEEVPPTYLDFPQVARINSNLEVFELELSDSIVDWKNASNWLGGKLKVLVLSSPCLMTPLDLGRILKNNTITLTSLRLGSISHPGDETDKETVQTSIQLSLPNLKTLTLGSLSLPLLDLFTTFSVYPSLQTLRFIDFEGEHGQESFDCFLAILKANSSTLAFIYCFPHRKADFNLPSEPLDIKLNQLEELQIGVPRLSLWFSTLASEFPQLSTLWSAESAHDAFQRKSPLLKTLKSY